MSIDNNEQFSMAGVKCMVWRISGVVEMEDIQVGVVWEFSCYGVYFLIWKIVEAL